MKKIFSTYPLFLFLLPVFFVLHGLTENLGLVPLRDAALLVLFYLGIALLLLALCWLLFRNDKKAAITAFALLSYQFFFGAVQDFGKKYFPGSFINKYSFILPLSLAGFLLLILLLKKTRKDLGKTVLYLNTLFALLMLVDGAGLTAKVLSKKPVMESSSLAWRDCRHCSRPDIYLIIADGYPGPAAARDLLDYDNSSFEEDLKKRGFYVTDSCRSNYNYTAFSVASLLSMDYLPGIRRNNNDKRDLELCMTRMKRSPFLGYLRQNGYRFYNYSLFSFDGQPAYTTPTFLPQKTLPITAQTFTRRIVRDLWYHLATTFRMPGVIRWYKYADKRNNEKLFDLTWKISEREGGPKFVYTHLMLPHHPLYYDSAGHLFPADQLGDFHFHDKKRRIGYLQYSNRKLLQLIDRIMSASKNPPVIFLAGDHGIRELREPFDDRYQFMTTSAVLLPGRDYSGFYKGQTHVNLLRVFLNTQFKQQLPLLPDSMVLITEF